MKPASQIAWKYDRLCCACILCLGVAVIAAMHLSPAQASQLIDRDVQQAALQVNGKGEAMLTYDKGGRVVHVLAWGAVNALPPTADASQTAFALDYSGGYGKYRVKGYWQQAGWTCLPYDGPALAWLLAACKAPDGSYWALQSWQRALPDLGATPTSSQRAVELHLSHWTGALPVLTITMNWSYRRFDHLFGTFTYRGVGVFGFHSTPSGVPLDSFGRNIYLDTYNSAYGGGWRRENSFLTHGPNGAFCYGLYPHGTRPSGKGTRYRATVIGPGVTPDVTWQGAAPGTYDAQENALLVAAERNLRDSKCTI